MGVVLKSSELAVWEVIFLTSLTLLTFSTKINERFHSAKILSAYVFSSVLRPINRG